MEIRQPTRSLLAIPSPRLGGNSHGRVSLLRELRHYPPVQSAYCYYNVI